MSPVRYQNCRIRLITQAAVVLGSVLLTIAASPAARAVTAVSVEGHASPVTLTVGEPTTMRFDVAKAGGTVQFTTTREVGGPGKFDPAGAHRSSTLLTDNGPGDTDSTATKMAFTEPASWVGIPVGRYYLHVADRSDGSSAVLPITIVPRPERQAISGRVSLSTGGGSGTAPLQDAVIWAARDATTLVASATIGADGSYTLPVPAGTYVVFAEWFGHLRSQRRMITVTDVQEVKDVNLVLLQGEEVSGVVKEGNRALANVPVEATAADGSKVSTPTQPDGAYTLVLPNGVYTVEAHGVARRVTVMDGPVDGVDFPPTVATSPKPAAGTILTIAGNGIPGYGGDGGPAINARIIVPQGLGIDRSGNIYVTSSGVPRLRKIDAAGIITTIAGSGSPDQIRNLTPLPDAAAGFSGDGGPALTAKVNVPSNVAVGATGDIYFTDNRNHRVRRIEAVTGIITTVAGSGPVGLGKGSFSGDDGPATAATLNGPRGLVVDAAGNLWIADSGNARIRRVDGSGTITTVAGGGKDPVTDGAKATAVALSNNPYSLALDKAGNLYVGDRGAARILKLSADGTLKVVAGTGKAGFGGDDLPAATTQIGGPFFMASDSAGNVYWTDEGNQRVRKLSPEGIVSTVAGSGPAPLTPPAFSGDGGPATAARLANPTGVAIDAEGNLIIAEQGSSRIRKVVGIAAPGLLAAGG